MVRVETTEQMYDAVLARFAECDALIAAAAPADYAPAASAPQKIKKGTEPLTVELQPTADILAECGRRKEPGQFLAGFAAETENLIAGAQDKLRSKNLDMIVANDVSRSDAGIDSDWNAGHLLFPDGRDVELPVMAKLAFAHRILEALAQERGGVGEQ